MRIKIVGEFLQFNDDVEVERNIKLFESLDNTQGDFSYQFDVPPTAVNIRLLGYPKLDVTDKPIYAGIDADLIDESGNTVYIGKIQVIKINNVRISCCFLSGNYNWINLLSDPLSDIDFSDLDTNLTSSGIESTWGNTDGIVMPLVDTGGLITRGTVDTVPKDFTGMIYAKTIMARIFNKHAIKLVGDLISDPIYNSLLISRQTYSESNIDNRSSYVGKGSDQNISVTDGLLTKVTFTDVTHPFFDGSNGNFVSSTYTADVDMDVKIESFLRFAETDVPAFPNDNLVRFKIYINGVEVKHRSIGLIGSSTSQTTSLEYSITLSAGSTVEIYALFAAFPNPYTFTIYSDSWIKITPSYLYRVFGNGLVPNWSQAKFVNNIISMFCGICDYDHKTKTLTIDLFEKIKTKEPIDISDFVEMVDSDTNEFISNFSKKNILKYGDSDADEIKQYNVRFYDPYGAGTIQIDNAFVPNSGSLFTSDFKAPVSYINPSFGGASLERIIFNIMDITDSTDITSVASSLGNMKVNVTDSTIFQIGDLARITESTNSEYNGDWYVFGIGSGFIVIENTYGGTATGKISKIVHRQVNTDDVYVFINTIYQSNNVSLYSGASNIKISNSDFPDMAYAFFNLLNTDRAINSSYSQGLAFGVTQRMLSYQRTILDTYWNLVGRILSDPIKGIFDANYPYSIWASLTPLRPIRVRTIETDNLYYLNRITGYKSAKYPCTTELIKLS